MKAQLVAAREAAVAPGTPSKVGSLPASVVRFGCCWLVYSTAHHTPRVSMWRAWRASVRAMSSAASNSRVSWLRRCVATFGRLGECAFIVMWLLLCP